MDTFEVVFEAQRGTLFGIAYRMLGSAMDAEDIVQEAYLRYQAVDPASVQHPRAFLIQIVTRLCLDYLKSARVQRETYVGEWLPEPVGTEGDPASPALAESVQMAFLLLMESLSPAERAVFLLHEVFEYAYGEISAIIGRDEAACRQLLHRAKAHIAQHKPRYQPSPEKQAALLGQFMQAAQAGDLDGLTRLLHADVVSVGDGGGKAAAVIRPVRGRTAVVRFVLGLMRQAAHYPGVAARVTTLNYQPALVVSLNGQVDTIMMLEFEGKQVIAIRNIRNPDKLNLRMLQDSPGST